MTETVVTREQVIDVLKKIYDPEILLDLWTLGLIYDIEIEDRQIDCAEIDGKKIDDKEIYKAIINIRMTFTSMSCPAGPYLVEEVRSHTQKIPGVEKTVVTVVFQPPWEPSVELRAMLGLD